MLDIVMIIISVSTNSLSKVFSCNYYDILPNNTFNI